MVTGHSATTTCVSRQIFISGANRRNELQNPWMNPYLLFLVLILLLLAFKKDPGIHAVRWPVVQKLPQLNKQIS